MAEAVTLLDRLREAAAKYLAEIFLGFALSALTAIAFFADSVLPPAAFDAIGRTATGKILLGLCLLLLLLIAWIFYLHPKLVFDRVVGAYVHRRTGQYYCSKCRHDRRIRVPLKDRIEGRGWACTVCGKMYDNPDFKEPPSPTRNDRRWIRI